MSEGRAIPASRLSWRDLVGEATSALLHRPGRAALTVLGTALGVGAFVAVLGLTASASSQIDARFTALAATEVTVTDSHAGAEIDRPAFTADAEQRLRALPGVVSGGLLWTVGDKKVRARSVRPGDAEAVSLAVLAVSPGALSAMHVRVTTGRTYDAFAEDRGLPVALVSAAVARQVGLAPLDGRPAVVVVDGVALVVTGVFDDALRRPDSLLAVLVPTSTARARWGEPGPDSGIGMLVETRVGAARVVASQAALALRPDAPDRLKVTAAQDPRVLRAGVAADLGGLFAGLAAVSLVVGAVGIANTVLVSVMERTPEIGLRRAVGARPRHIAAQFLTEGLMLGLLGGLLGAAAGVLTVLVTAVVRDWTPVMQPTATLPAPLIGAVTGVLASLYPAWRAARVQPVAALQR